VLHPTETRTPSCGSITPGALHGQDEQDWCFTTAKCIPSSRMAGEVVLTCTCAPIRC
jgi:hypothetical protein